MVSAAVAALVGLLAVPGRLAHAVAALVCVAAAQPALDAGRGSPVATCRRGTVPPAQQQPPREKPPVW